MKTNKELETKSLREVLLRCQQDPVYFIENFIQIPSREKGGPIPFELYDFQRDAVRSFADERFNIVLKSRQLGFSTVTAAYALWAAMFNGDKGILVVATKLDVAKNLFKTVKYCWKSLPPVFHRIIKYTYMTKQEIEFSNGSFIKAVPTGDDVGRSESLSMLIVDEAAFIDNFHDVYQNTFPTLSQTGGRMVVISTPGPIGNQYHKLWVDAEKGKNPFKPIKLDWRVHPDRDEEWYKLISSGMSKKQFDTEFNCCFEGASNTYFKEEIIDKVSSSAIYPKYIEEDSVWMWEYPQKNHRYIMGCDIARGDEGDYSSFQIIDFDTKQVVAEDQRHEDPQSFAERAVRWCRRYNGALLVPESNNHGYAFLLKVKELDYRNLFFNDIKHWEAAKLGDIDVNKAGFSTQYASKQLALIKLDDAIRQDKIKIYSNRVVSEFRTLLVKKNQNGNEVVRSVKGRHDDMLMALAIANLISYYCETDEHKIMLGDSAGGKAEWVAINVNNKNVGNDPSAISRLVGEPLPKIINSNNNYGFISRTSNSKVIAKEIEAFYKIASN